MTGTFISPNGMTMINDLREHLVCHASTTLSRISQEQLQSNLPGVNAVF